MIHMEHNNLHHNSLLMITFQEMFLHLHILEDGPASPRVSS